MPKLNDEKAQAVNEAEGNTDFQPLDEGVYTVQLREDVEVKEGPAGVYWRWTFEIPEGMENAGRRLWVNTSLSDKAYWKLKETFDAFGVPANTDTEDLVKRRVKALVVITTIERGAKQGQLTNEVKQLLPLDSDSDVPAQGGAAEKTLAGSTDGPLF